MAWLRRSILGTLLLTTACYAAATFSDDVDEQLRLENAQH